jgi:hypothetical protein
MSGLLTRLLAAGVTAAVVVLGIWVSGGLITNDFNLAMTLTAVWMAIAALGCVLVAWRRRDLRLPLVGAYLLTAAVAGVYLGRSQLFDDRVNERVATVSPVTPDRPRNVLLGRASFEPVAHSASGTASTIRLAGGSRVLTLTGFEVSNGPDLRVYLVAGPARDEAEVDEFHDLGALKGNIGNQQYEIPRGVDLERLSTVVIWCRAFSVNFARAPLA